MSSNFIPKVSERLFIVHFSHRGNNSMEFSGSTRHLHLAWNHEALSARLKFSLANETPNRYHNLRNKSRPPSDLIEDLPVRQALVVPYIQAYFLLQDFHHRLIHGIFSPLKPLLEANILRWLTITLVYPILHNEVPHLIESEV